MISNGKTVEQVARELIDQHGSDALRILRERAEIADELGDKLAAMAWRDIADAVEYLLSTVQAPAIRP